MRKELFDKLIKMLEEKCDYEKGVDELKQELNSLPIPIPYVGQELQSFVWITELDSVQFEDMIFSIMNYRKRYREIVREIHKIERLNDED